MAKTNVTDRAGSAFNTAREHPYVKRVIEDQELRQSLQEAFVAARKAYGRISDSKGGPVQAVSSDKKVKRDLRSAAESLKEVSERLREPERKRHRIRKVLAFGLIATGAVLILSEGARKTVLDAIFGAEEEFTYTSTTTPEDAATNGAPNAE